MLSLSQWERSRQQSPVEEPECSRGGLAWWALGAVLRTAEWPHTRTPKDTP